MSNPSTAIVPVAQAIQQWTSDDQALIRRMVAPKANDQEFKVYLYQAYTLKLDPLQREIYAIRYKDGEPISIVVAHAGLLSIAHRTGQYGGMDSDCLYSPDGKLTGAIATVWRKDSEHPTVVRVKFAEYNPSNRQWQAKPETMIKKVAEAQALRRAFNISGVYIAEEFGSTEEALEGEYSEVSTGATEQPATGYDPHDTSNGHARPQAPEQRKQLSALLKQVPWFTGKHLLARYDTEDSKALDYHSMADLLTYLETVKGTTSPPVAAVSTEPPDQLFEEL